ncbi:saccharopine dehydrogenase [Actinophytocola xinjiangensis]|uniref:Saccharopine dehydrogenase n=1 Tax=Actinophytocola xinjiangensis TaxID=485602 RepID=A0A7Z0WSS6_9PSEU|nr:saccharopine dehydrogenase [Actinophytocola xinjiangensis]OLF14129.1 saccharopine dehydrogenase [Actinophytocola xinjiangensis]
MSRQLWLRAETRASERRAPITPGGVATLIADGHTVTVEDSPRRVFPTDAYAEAGATIADAGSWVGAPADAVIVGLKELPDEPAELRHRHVFFGHAFKHQPDAARLLGRFAAGGGTLLDLEYLTDEGGRRLAAFGYWAGYVGAAVTVLLHRGQLDVPLRPTTRPELDARLASTPDGTGALVLGALGRCGRGATDGFRAAGLTPTRWDLAETRDLDRAALLDHELLLNAVLATEPGTPFLTPADLDRPRRLAVVCDVTCDVGSPCNLLPIYDAVTSWEDPADRLRTDPPLDLIAVDNLPSLLPEESSVAFAEDLLPHLRDLDGGPWRRCARLFTAALDEESTHG